MSARLKRYAYAPLVALALWAVLLALSPAIANAKETSQTNDPQGSKNSVATSAAGYVLVAPGDSLWSISERQLGPNASGPQIARGAERLYTLNRDQIGADPNAIYVGQRFVLPRSLEHPAPQEMPEPASAAAKGAHGTAAPARPSPAHRTAESGADRASGQTVGSSGERNARDSQAAVQRRSLPEEAEAAPVPVVRSLAADGIPRSPVAYLSGARALVSLPASALVDSFDALDRYTDRQLFGFALILLSLALGAFPLFLTIIRAARRAMVRREYKRNWYRSAQAAYAATPFAGVAPHPEERRLKTRPAPSGEHEQVTGSVNSAGSSNSTNGNGALGNARGDVVLAQLASDRRSSRRGPAPNTGQQRIDRSQKTMEENPPVPDAPGAWDISERLKGSLESVPLQPAPMTLALAELRPQVEDELRAVARLESSRPLSEREHRKESALRSLLALAQEGSNAESMAGSMRL